MKTIGSKSITDTQRLQIEALNNAKVPKKVIAETVGITLRTLYNELKRGAYKHKVKWSNFWSEKIRFEIRYSAQIAHDKYVAASNARGRPIKLGKDFAFVDYIEKRVKEDKLSACAALGEIKHKGLHFETQISKPTLYRYIELGFFPNLKIDKRNRSYRHVIQKRPPRGTSIERRPVEIGLRKTFGHWEMDCVVGSTLPTLLVLSERLTRKEIIFKMDNRKAASVVKCINILERRFGKNFRRIFKSITVDNGVEFSDFKGLEKSIYGNFKRTSVYYCHPYTSCERGTNERLNREIRRLIPKSSDLSQYSTKDIQFVEDWINRYPRQIFGYATSDEMFNSCMRAI